MPNIKSAMKRMRSDARKNERNQKCLSELRSLDAKLRKSAKDKKKATEIAERLISRLDKAVSRGIIPRSRADRKKSRVSKFVQKIKK